MREERGGWQEGPALLTAQQVAVLLAVSVRTVWRLVAADQFPQPVRYNRKLVRWKAAEVMRYLEGLS